ncbi:MAG TPA: hypothetical protein VGJ20_29690, partial [Xanthobacteraceae bacterium]
MDPNRTQSLAGPKGSVKCGNRRVPVPFHKMTVHVEGDSRAAVAEPAADREDICPRNWAAFPLSSLGPGSNH